MELRDYRTEDWEDVRSFLRTHWRPNHPLTEPEIFQWQFAGFGGFDRPVSQVVRDGRDIVGFLGGIPGLYRASGDIVPGVAFDVWIIHPQVQNRGLGLLLMKALEDRFQACCSLGVNRKIIHYYTRRGYCHGEGLHRWIAPLRMDGCQRLVARASEVRETVGTPGTPSSVAVAPVPPARSRTRLNAELLRPLVETHSRLLAASAATTSPQTAADPEALATLFAQTTARFLRFGLHRTAEFWTWRYLRSKGYSYLFFGEPTGPGVVIGRVERVACPGCVELHGLPVLRLIELLPARPATWEGITDEDFAGLLAGVLRWAAEQGCVLADFQHSSRRLARPLEWLGFASQTPAAPPVFRSLPHLFQPLRYDTLPINYVFRSRPASGTDVAIDTRDLYLVKSDAGMDRPNVWPLTAASA